MTSFWSRLAFWRLPTSDGAARPNWWGELALFMVGLLITLGGTGMAAKNDDETHVYGAVGITLLTIGMVAVPFRRRYPGWALAVALLSTVAYNTLGYAKGPIFLALIVTFVNAVLSGHRRAAIASLVVGFLAMPWLGYVVDRSERPTLAEVLALSGWLIGLLGIAEAIRYRRDQAAEAERSREEAGRRQASDERLRIARELHDVVAHNMSLISIQAGVALHLMDERPEQVRESLTTIKQASKEALVELRSILGVLRQVDVDGRSPVPTLQRLDELLERGRGAGLEITLEDGVDPDGLPRDVDLAAYRIVQESLTNAARHSDDPRVTVRIGTEDGGLVVEVLDEGSGHHGAASESELPPGGGNGIVGMRERAAAVGGRLEVGPRPGRGFAVRAWLPLPERAEPPGDPPADPTADRPDQDREELTT